jgi:hypothetical protein
MATKAVKRRTEIQDEEWQIKALVNDTSSVALVFCGTRRFCIHFELY